jgi:hypothetical protein
MAQEQIRLPDPATNGSYEWTQEDIDAVLHRLGQMAMQGTFNPTTWEGQTLTIRIAGQERQVMPKYFGYVYSQWQKLAAGTGGD